MSSISATLIDVGWGDSILLESVDQHGDTSYGLIDCNDSVSSRSSHIFLKRFFERKGFTFPFKGNPIFKWVLLTHAHADHAQGLKRILRDFGAEHFWYPQSSSKAVFFTSIIRFATRSSRILHYQTLDSSLALPSFGAAKMEVLWPPPGTISANENDNSVVLALTLDSVTFVLTGDAEADGVWSKIANRVPASTRLFKVPHHGANNGMFDGAGKTPWLSALPPQAKVAISSHVRPFSHPSTIVMDELKRHNIDAYRTDEQSHLTFATQGSSVNVHYRH